MDLSNLISLKQYAELHSVDPATVRQKILRGNLEAVKIGRDWMVDKNLKYVDFRKRNG